MGQTGGSSPTIILWSYEGDQAMDKVDEATRESLSGASVSRPNSASALPPSAELAVVPADNSQSDIASLLLQL